MTTQAPPTRTPVAAPSSRSATRAATALAYARLAKLDVFDYYLSLGVVWAMLPPAERLRPRTLVFLGLFLGGQIALCAALCAFDDVTGYRDGSDPANYGPDRPARRLRRKPLVAGTLSQRQAIGFGWAMTAAHTAVWAAALAVAPHRTTWALVAVVVCTVLGFQYSWGLTLSYHGMQELFVLALGWAYLLPPYGLLTGRATGAALVQTALFALGPLLFGVYSNTNDIEGDRAVNRPTAANLLSPRGNRRFIAALSLAEAALVLAAPLLGFAPGWFPLLLAPLLAMRLRQFAVGMLNGRILEARRLGIHAHRVGAGLLVAADLLHGGIR